MPTKREQTENSNVVRGVEIFSPGTHNGDVYTEQDLDEMVAASKRLDFRPALKVGHTKDAPGAPAYGWVTNLRKAGGKLVADFESMHDSVIQALKDRRYDRVSSEIYFNLKRGDNTFRRALKAVALLGADVPAVAGLVPLHKMEFAETGFDGLAACDQSLQVSQEAIIASLTERVAAMNELLTEKDEDMKTIKELKEAKAALEKQLAELSQKGDKMTDEEKAAMKKCSADISNFGDEISRMEKAEVDAKELAELRAAKATLEADQKAAQERLAALEAKDRAREVADRVSRCTVPAFRPFAAALYNYALANGKAEVKVYSTDSAGKQVEEIKSLADLTDSIVASINDQSKRLFTVVSKGGKEPRKEGPTGEDPGAEVDRLAQQRLRDKKSSNYDEAMDAVLAENPELAKQYADAQTARHA